jgi:signal peptidase II
MIRIPDAVLFIAIITLDRATKVLVPAVMDLHESIPVIPGFFNFTYVRNPGGAFGMLAGWDSPLRRIFFIGASLLALGLLIYLYRQAAGSPARGLGLSLMAIAGGAVGNLYERITSGQVVDFLDAYVGSHHFPAFNIADSAITVGACVLFYYYVTGKADELLIPGGEDQDAA